MSLFDDFPTRKKVLLLKDVSEIQRIISSIDNAVDHRKDIQKFATTAAYAHISDSLTALTTMSRISECCDYHRLKEIEENFRNSVMQELDKFILEKTTQLKKEYNVLYQSKETRYDGRIC